MLFLKKVARCLSVPKIGCTKYRIPSASLCKLTTFALDLHIYFPSMAGRYWNDNAGGVLVAELPVGTNSYTIPVLASERFNEVPVIPRKSGEMQKNEGQGLTNTSDTKNKQKKSAGSLQGVLHFA